MEQFLALPTLVYPTTYSAHRRVPPIANARLNQSVHENRIYSVNIHCGPEYPDKPPTIQFISQVNVPCVDQRSGKVGWD